MITSISKPVTLVPRIIREYFDEDDVRMYRCEGGRLFVADLYDRNFAVTRGKVIPKHYRGDGSIGQPKNMKGVTTPVKKVKR